MEKVHLKSKKTKARIEWSAFWFFSVTSLFSWLFAEQLALVFLYVPEHVISDDFLFQRAQVVILSCVTFIYALLAYGFVIWYKLSKKTNEIFLDEVMSDSMLSRGQFHKLYDSSPVPYFLMDDVGNIRNPNRAALRFLGGTVEECVSTNFYTLFPDDVNAQKTMSLFRTKVDNFVPISQEEMRISAINASGERYALVSIYSLDRNSPIPFKHLVTLVDVSREKESERVKTDFLLLASHQLRTPLTTVKWYIDYLLASDTSKMSSIVREYLEQIYIGNERMIELITTLLTVSRIEMGTLAPEYVTVKVNEIIDDILEELATDIRSKKIKIQKRSVGDDALVMDHTMLRIIIHNLLTNAVKYTPAEGIVNIDSKFLHHSCTISVADTGYGIPESEQKRIFTKMFRATNAKKISTNGTGLGLYMSKAFVEKFGGEIKFKSEEGSGSTFIISLPRVASGA